MKELKDFLITNENINITKSKFLNNLHIELTDAEMQITNKLAELISYNNTLTVNVDGADINFLTNSEEDNKEMHDLYSVAGILVEKYLVYLLNKEINSESYFGSDFEQVLSQKNIDNGSYKSYDLELNDLCFEIKCYHKLDNEGIYLSNKQKSQIGPDAYLILVQVGIGKNNIMIKDIVVKQFKNLKVSGNYIKGAK